MKLFNYQHYRMIDLVANQIGSDRGYKYEAHRRWETTKPDAVVAVLGEFNVIHHQYDTATGALLVEFDTAIAIIEDSKASAAISVEVQTDNFGVIEEIYSKIRAILPEGNQPRPEEISVKFWYNAPNGPKFVHRNIDAPRWARISSNYTKHTEEGLKHLMHDFNPSGGGKLILWHGEPGTGKTYALRALCQEWKDWCSVEYIMDPEILLGASPGYLATLIMNANDYDDDDEEEVKKRSQWKLLVMEDTGELLTEDARLRSGQGLSRLLNVVDGFIGQGLKVLVLITTNEEFDKLHPAVAREGRAAAAIKFDGLTTQEAEKFLRRHGSNENLPMNNGPYKIADLFAKVNGNKSPRDNEGIKRNGLGFRIPETAQKV